ncbi:peroxiredoxin family protein [Hymenobacter terrenus]|uniref:peroxiredoxin family protein n=1 Tax=Hymenobacter terrenus TaxID=1629124 RepID=UPI000619B89B|nr:redoxin domain-containing protein [Hymenobacter terrenus]
MKLVARQPAPDFNAQDAYGKPVSLAALRGQKVWLAFYRTAGCPVCNVRFHEVEKESAYLKSKGVVALAVYMSQAPNLRKYLADQPVYPTVLPDPEGRLYKLYDTESSVGKLMSGLLFHGGLGQMNKGKKLPFNGATDVGPKTLIGAEFLIDEAGQVATAYYGKYSGDFLPLADVKAFAAR